MSVRVRGGMYCPTCKKPVLAQRSGHAVRNTVGAAATLGLALKSERWRCPDCGGIAYPKGTAHATAKQARQQEAAAAALTAVLFVTIILGFVAHSALVSLGVLVVGIFLLRRVLARGFMP